MKVWYLIFLGMVLSLSGYSQKSDTLVYNPEKKLTWDDFKGKPNYSRSEAGAQIIVSINLRVKKVSFWSGKTTYDVYAIAFRNQSWVKPGYKDAYTLAHEQVHFDIAHIFAETLELQLNSLGADEQKEKVEELLQKNSREMGQYQVLYDRETNGGNNKTKQKQWAEKIAADLKILI
ncbi:DUF922 domain-containing protein [Adhaeribacter aquaticus]|uniref:DUF922 domain-containing protein n=1 Tax=Adhaeribacter aquaticus TaxID=299567 RepID=UPI000479A8DD|nr:DUF922 domain-containing protein [Adhaeribacter aquaticus]